MGTQDIMGSENVTKLILKFSLPAIIGMLVNGPVSYTHLITMPFGSASKPLLI